MSHNQKEVFVKEETKISKILHEGITSLVGDKSQLFALKEKTLKCMDERTPGGIHLAGAGILLGEEKTLQFIKDAQIEKVTWHKECGAVGLYLKKQGQTPSGEQIDEEAKKFAEALAKKAGIEVAEEEMAGETSFHAARAIYFDNTGEFNFTEDLPTGFVISRKFLPSDYAAEELKIAVSIAFGDHGFGKLFSVEQPLLVVAVSSLDEIDPIQQEIEAALIDIDEYKEGRIKLDHIIA